MTCSIFFNMVLAGGLFFLNGWLGRIQYGMPNNPFEYGKFCFESKESENFSGNFFLKTVNPAIYLSIVAAAIQGRLPNQYMDSLWLLVPCFWVWRFLYMIVKNRMIFLNFKYELASCFTSLLLSEAVFFWIICPLIAEGESIWISTTEIRDAVWFAIIAYVVKAIWDIMKRKFQGDVLYPIEKKKQIINNRYDKFSRKYGLFIRNEIEEHYSLAEERKGQLICVVYAVMIFEDYNRPPVIRMLEYAAKFILPWRTMTLGIMQVSSNRMIFSKESIWVAIEKLAQPFVGENEDMITTAIKSYNNGDDYYSEVRAIYDELAQLLGYDFNYFSAEDHSNESYKI